MSENSSARTWVIADERDDTISGNRSVMPPGWMHDPCRVHTAARGAHVLAGPQNRYDLVVVGDQRAVHHAVGVEGQHLVDAGRGRDAQRSGGAEDLADVAPVLVGAVHP